MTDTAAAWECVECSAPLSITEAADHVRACCPDPPHRADLDDDEDDVMTGIGDAAPYACPRCPAELPLSELLDHIAIAHPDLEPTRTNQRVKENNMSSSRTIDIIRAALPVTRQQDADADTKALQMHCADASPRVVYNVACLAASVLDQLCQMTGQNVERILDQLAREYEEGGGVDDPA